MWTQFSLGLAACIVGAVATFGCQPTRSTRDSVQVTANTAAQRETDQTTTATSTGATSAEPAATTATRESTAKHWAFRPVSSPPLPAVQDASWARNPIDHFVLARLERDQLRPALAADRHTLLRRLSLDLVGLPPTLDEVTAFVNDRSPNAYERAVDRLLASHHFGEKWARHWLDLCYYADTDGYLTDQPRPYAWRYRQWVVDALNRDLPFDEFTTQQLAGDRLADPGISEKIATGFLRNTLSNREGGADLEEFRVEQTVARTRLVGTVWLGLTVGCARCHDHKYDPLSQKEFYELYAFFNNAAEINIDAPRRDEEEPYAAARKEYEDQRQRVLAPLAAEIDSLQALWEAKLLAALASPGEDHVWDRQWELLGLVWGGGKGEGQLEGTEIVQTPVFQRTTLQKERLLDYFLRSGSVIDPARWKELGLDQVNSKLVDLKKSLPPMTRAPAMHNSLVERPTYIHVRGSFRDRGGVVQTRTPAILPRADLVGEHSNTESIAVDPDARLRLAEWLLSPENPLTARVTVNRFWQELFGHGLVRTPGDFGVRGEAPTHPQLLDWLALEFRRQGWSVKRFFAWS